MKRFTKICVCILSVVVVVALTVLPSFCAPELFQENFTTWDMITSAQMDGASEYYQVEFDTEFLDEWAEFNRYRYYYGSVLMISPGVSSVSCDPFVASGITTFSSIDIFPFCYLNLYISNGGYFRLFSRLQVQFFDTPNVFQFRFVDIEDPSLFVFFVAEFSELNHTYSLTDITLYDHDSYISLQDVDQSFSLQLDYSYFSNNPYSLKLYSLMLTLLTSNTDIRSVPSFVFGNSNYLSELDSINSYISSSYTDGYDFGYFRGVTDGLESGFDNGYDVGYDEGYAIGKAEGTAIADIGTLPEAINAAVTAPVSALISMLDFEILGINMFGFLGSILAVCLVVIIIKLVKK